MEVRNNFLWSRQPYKFFYLSYVISTYLLFRLPFWFLTSLVPALRPRATWTIRRTLLIKSLQVIVPVVFDTAAFKAVRADPHAFAKNEDEVGMVWIDAAPELVVGEIKKYAKINKVSAAQVPAFWFGDRDTVTNLAGQRALPDEKVILNFHSGGWVLGDAVPGSISAGICQDMLARFPQFSRALNVEYRLCQGPPFPIENPFPAALIDAVHAYNYLVNEVGFKPANILVMGDSAGAILAHQLVRYVAGAGLPGLGVPGGLFLASPSMDWGDSHRGPGSSFQRNTKTDWVHAFNAGYGTAALLGRLPPSEANENAWISPASRKLPRKEGLWTGFPDTLFFAGDSEMTLDAMKTASERLAQDNGEEKVEFILQKDATHVIFALPWHEREKEEAFKLITPWIDRHF